MTLAYPQLGLSFRFERGGWADYLALAEYHYRARRPATMRSVWRLVAQWDGRKSECGIRNSESKTASTPSAAPASSFRIPNSEFRISPAPLLWQFAGYPALAGVVVVSCPAINAAARNKVTASRYCTPGHPRDGIARLNREVLTLSRVIVHPLYRGLGLAPRLVAAVLDRLDVPLVEAFARMGRYVPFFRQAGMSELKLPGKPVYYYFRRTPCHAETSIG